VADQHPRRGHPIGPQGLAQAIVVHGQSGSTIDLVGQRVASGLQVDEVGVLGRQSGGRQGENAGGGEEHERGDRTGLAGPMRVGCRRDTIR